MSVTELKDDTSGSEHHAIREMILSLRIMGVPMVTATNVRNAILGHATFAGRRIDVIIVKLGTTNSSNGPFTNDFDCTTTARFNIQRVEGVGDVIIVMPR